MECIAPGEITEEQLLAYADGEADSVTQDHVRRCSHCAERARSYANDQLALRVLFQRAECPDAHALSEYQQGLLPATEHATIEDHLRICSDCAREIAELDHFLKKVPIAPALPSIPHELKRLVARRASPPPGTQIQQQALAFRGATAAPPDVYEAEDIKVVVGLEADGLRAGRKMLLGFTTREGQPLASLTGAQAQLSRRGETVAMEQVDALGNFVFNDLISGEYELVLVTEQEQVVIETIVI
jgi:hypothetical protein